MSGKKSVPAADSERVSLKPIFGVAPGVYLSALYAAGILLILALILVVPGLASPGMRVSIQSIPSGAAVRLDDIYRAASPCTILVPPGQHRITITAPGFAPQELPIESRSRVFASLFRPPAKTLVVRLEAPKPLEALAGAAGEFAAWSMTGEPQEKWQIPLVLSEAAWRLGPWLRDAHAEADDILGAAARFVKWPHQARDLSRAAFLLDNEGLPPSPTSGLDSLRRWLSVFSENPQSALVLSSLVDGELKEDLLSSSWYAAAAVAPQDPSGSSRAGRTITIAGIDFSEIVDSGNKSWWIAREEVSSARWQRFIAETPYWAAENRPGLIDSGLVTDSYLSGLKNLEQGPSRHSISWYAARAWCTWFEASLPASFASWKVRLPTEAEWEEAAALEKALALRDMNDSLWEWCEEPWVHHPLIGAGEDAVKLVGSPLRPVKGGSWANSRGSIKIDTRGAQTPESCNPWTGFRPVLVRGAIP